MKSYDELNSKSISELIIPEQFQTIAHITSCLANNQCDELLMKEIFDFINNSKNNYTSILYILYSLSKAFPKNDSSYSEIGESIKANFKSFEFKHRYFFTQEYDHIFNKQKVAHLIAFDKLDDLIINIERGPINVNQEVKGMSLIDIACKFGSEKCFSYLKLKGANISDRTSIYAVEGGNKNIIINLHSTNCFEISDNHLTTALKYHHNEIFDWLLETKGSIGKLNTAECFYFGNITGLLYLVQNGFELNMLCIIQILFIIIMLTLSYTFVLHISK